MAASTAIFRSDSMARMPRTTPRTTAVIDLRILFDEFLGREQAMPVKRQAVICIGEKPDLLLGNFGGRHVHDDGVHAA